MSKFRLAKVKDFGITFFGPVFTREDCEKYLRDIHAAGFVNTVMVNLETPIQETKVKKKKQTTFKQREAKRKRNIEGNFNFQKLLQQTTY